MHRKIFIEQLKRSKKTVFYLLLLIVATAFFVTSLNLYHNSTSNLQKAEETYSTLAVTELYGDIDQYGNLVEENSQTHVGYKAAAVKGYDISQIIGSESVESWDLRTQYGAYIEDCPAMGYAPQVLGDGTEIPEWGMRSNNIIRFRIQAKEPLELKYHYDPNTLEAYHFGLDVIEDAAGCFEYPEKMFYSNLGFKPEEWEAHAQDIKAFNQTEDTDRLILYPDVEYVAILRRHGSWLWNEEGTLKYTTTSDGYSTNFNLTAPVQDYQNIQLTYDGGREGLEYEVGDIPFPIQRWEDVQNDPKLKAYFDDLWQDIHVQQYTHNVVATNDVTSIPAFHLGNTALCEGRLITEEEYESGAKVCLISKELTENQQWKIGDKLNMKLFESDYLPNAPFIPDQPIYDAEKTPFVDEGEYEIVGIYERWGYALGDTIPLLARVLVSKNYLEGIFRMKVVGTYPGKITGIAAVMPLKTMKDLTVAANSVQKQNGSYYEWNFGLREVYFTVKDNQQLPQIKTMITENGLRDSKFARVRIDDRILKETVGPIESNLAQLEGSYLFFFVMIAAIGFFLSFLLARGRKPEYAVMRMLGESRTQITIKALCEQFVLCLAGVTLGAAAVGVQEKSSFEPTICAVILLCYTLGAAVAVMLTVRVNVMDILRDKE